MNSLRSFFPIFLVLTASAFAQTWTGTTSSDWSTPSNWSGGAVPTGNTIVNGNGTNAPVVGSANAAVSNLTLGSTSNSVVQLTVQNGFRFNSGNTYIGNTASASVNLTVTGTGSQLVANSLYPAYSGTGSLNITNGGKVTSTVGIVGFSANSNGSVTVDGSGSQWIDSGALAVGSSGSSLDTTSTGNGALTITNGGKVTNTNAFLGYHDTALGSVTVNGTGSQWNSSGFLTIGNSGGGILSIEAGGTVTSAGARITTPNSVATAGNQSSVSLTGTGSTWTNTDTLSIGGFGAVGSTLTLGAGTTVQSTGLITLANDPLYAATITQTGGTLAANGGLKFSTGTSIYHLQGGTLQVGGTDGIQASTGTYNFDLSGGTVKVAGSNLTTQVNGTLATGTTTTLDSNGFSGAWSGNLSGSGSLAKIGSGAFTLSGTNTYGGSTSITTGTLALGANTALPSSTALSVANGATLAVGTAYASAGSLTGAGAVTFNGGGLTVGSDNTDTLFSGTISGSGSLSKNGTGTLTLSGSNSYAHTTVASGKLIVAASVGNSAIGTGVFTVGPSATFAGSGNVAASLTTMQGTLLPGDAGVATLNFANSLTLAGTSILQLDLASAGNYDQLFIGGTFTTGGALSVSLLNGYDPVTGTSFHLFNTTNPIAGTFSSVSLPSLDAGLSWDTTSLYTSGTLAVTTSAVPEPATYGLLIGAIGLVAAIRRRIRS